jgi:hypothetical protein
MRSSSRSSLRVKFSKVKMGKERLFQQYGQKARACGSELSFAESAVFFGADDPLRLGTLEHRA